MTDKLGTGIMKYRLAGLAVLAAIFYNNWLLAPWLNRNLFKHNGSVSEYSVASQPYYWIFRSLDIAAGILLLSIGLILWQHLKARLSGRVLAAGTAVLGLANIFDAIWRLPCSETLNPVCQIPVIISASRIEIPSHAYSSVVIGICYLLLPLASLVYARKHRIRGIVIFSWLLVGNSLYSFVAAIAGYIRAGALTTRTSGGGQEIQMLLLGMWAIACFTALGNRRLNSRQQEGNGY